MGVSIREVLPAALFLALVAIGFLCCFCWRRCKCRRNRDVEAVYNDPPAARDNAAQAQAAAVQPVDAARGNAAAAAVQPGKAAAAVQPVDAARGNAAAAAVQPVDAARGKAAAAVQPVDAARGNAAAAAVQPVVAARGNAAAAAVQPVVAARGNAAAAAVQPVDAARGKSAAAVPVDAARGNAAAAAVQPVDAARGNAAAAAVQPVVAARGNAAAAAVQPVDAARKHLRIFDYAVLKKATNLFSEEAEIGRGAFGVVYKATIDKDELRAVKKLKDKIRDETQKAYFKEIDTAGELRHRNLVQLVGYSYEPKRQALLMVFEYVPNGNLHRHLFDKQQTFRWEDRYKIALGLAAGVDYLHSGCKKCLIHRDIKPDNVMLANDFTPLLGDFGLARLTDHDASMNTTGQGGTFGYMAPEIFTGAKASKESDVFSFGVVLLQIATGQKDLMVADVELPLVSWVWSLNAEAPGRVLDAVDTKLGANYDAEQATRLLVVGLLCCHSTASGRPTIDQAKSMLKVKGHPLMPVKPLEGYYKDALSKTPTTRTTAKEKHKNIGATQPSKVPPGPTPNTLKSSPKVPQGATAPNKPLNPIQAGSSSKYYTEDEDKIIGATQRPKVPPGPTSKILNSSRTDNLAPVDNKTADAPLPPKAPPRRTPKSTDQKPRS